MAHRQRANSRSNRFSCLTDAEDFGHLVRALARLAGTHSAAANLSGSSRMNSGLAPPETAAAISPPRIILRTFEYASQGVYFIRKSALPRIIIRLAPGRSDCIIMTFVLQTVTTSAAFYAARCSVELTRHCGTANRTLVVFEPGLL